MKNTYKGIVFAKGYNKSFAEFKTEFEHTHVFRNIPSAERQKALKDAHKIATRPVITKEEILKTDVIAEIEKGKNGNTGSTTGKLEETK